MSTPRCRRLPGAAICRPAAIHGRRQKDAAGPDRPRPRARPVGRRRCHPPTQNPQI